MGFADLLGINAMGHFGRQEQLPRGFKLLNPCALRTGQSAARPRQLLSQITPPQPQLFGQQGFDLLNVMFNSGATHEAELSPAPLHWQSLESAPNLRPC